jgi:hypothetical protein
VDGRDHRAIELALSEQDRDRPHVVVAAVEQKG